MLYANRNDYSVVYLARLRDDGFWEMKKLGSEAVGLISEETFRGIYVRKG